jgi:predicted DNA-binding transcriptional regulator AlpA
MSIEIKHRFLRISEVKSTTGLSRSHIYIYLSPKVSFQGNINLERELLAGWNQKF